MKKYLHDSEPSSYRNLYIKSKILTPYGDSIFVAEGRWLHDFVTFRKKTNTILWDFSLMPKDEEEPQKRALIGSGANLIKSDIKSVIEPVLSEYPKDWDITMEPALEYVPPTLRFMLQFLVGKDTQHKLSCIGHAFFQAVRQKTVTQKHRGLNKR